MIFSSGLFLNNLDCVSRVAENYLGHSTVSSERDIDRVYGGKTKKSVQIASKPEKLTTSLEGYSGLIPGATRIGPTTPPCFWFISNEAMFALGRVHR